MVSVLGVVRDISPEEGDMGNCLSIGCYRIVFVKAKVNKARMKWAQDILHESKGIFAGPMLNEDLSKLISSWAEHRGDHSTRGCPSGLTVGPCNE